MIAIMIVIIVTMIIIKMIILIVIVIILIIDHSTLDLLGVEFHYFFYIWYFHSNNSSYKFEKFMWPEVLFYFFSYYFSPNFII